ncbi:MOSC domain-containing protein [Bauldia sp.]|uniref:MOSC domain-containing protein n=1 Tax=Bauldia sp. TaxID=2575872 RepID=UPI003BA86ED2
MSADEPTVVAVAVSGGHTFSKPTTGEIRLLAGLGIEGDAHCGATVKHRSRVARDPTQPNLRQVHLLQSELFAELSDKGFSVGPGEIGENVTTTGIDLLGLPTGTRLVLGDAAEVVVTGLRNPCYQLDDFQDGLTRATLDRDADGGLVRKAGVMATVAVSGVVRPGDKITAILPAEPYQPLERV